MMTTATTAAATVSGERRKLHIKSLSTARDHHPHCAVCDRACRDCVQACSALLDAGALEELHKLARS